MQVSSALLCLRQRNTYRGSSPHTVVKTMDNLSGPGSLSNSYGYSCDVQESASHMREIVESSRAKAHKMVDAAMQVWKGHFVVCYSMSWGLLGSCHRKLLI